MAEKRKLLQRYMQCLNEMQDELKRKELANKMAALEKMQCELARRQDIKSTQAPDQVKAKERRKFLKMILSAYQRNLDGMLGQLARKQALVDGDRGSVSQSDNLPHPEMLEEYTVSFRCVGEDGRELLEAALAARRCAYVPYSNFKVGAAFRSKCGTIYSGCNIENVAYTPGNCAERCALGKGISEGEKHYTAGAVVAYHPDGFTTPCGVCRQFIREFAYKDFPIYIAKAPPPEREKNIPAIQDDDEVLVTSAYNLLPHSFSACT
ncbi:hypothetical protein KR009_012206 [Drosophila setifemur]|nr:hypothetical protein KR009_012206 [Drosophila setifemur]